MKEYQYRERISQCEEQVMVVVWSSVEAPNLAAVMNAVNEKFDHAWKPQTVSTFLARLVKKRVPYLLSKREIQLLCAGSIPRRLPATGDAKDRRYVVCWRNE